MMRGIAPQTKEETNSKAADADASARPNDIDAYGDDDGVGGDDAYGDLPLSRNAFGEELMAITISTATT